MTLQELAESIGEDAVERNLPRMRAARTDGRLRWPYDDLAWAGVTGYLPIPDDLPELENER